MESEELYCSVCNQTVNENDEICSYCGSDLLELEDVSPSANKYKTLLQLIETIKILAGVGSGISLLGIIYGIYIFSMLIVTYALVLGLQTLTIFAGLEVIKLFMDLEQNSRVQTRLLNKLLNGNSK